MIPHKMFPHLFPILFSHLLHSQHEIIGVRFHPSNNDDNGGSTHHHRHFLHASSSSTPNLRHRYCTLPILFSRRKHALQLHPLFSHSQLPSRHPQRRWLCDGMIFNHDPPICADCWDCGGPKHCGMECNALVANNVGGYHVCTAIGRGPKIDVDIIDKKNPHTGVIVKMSNSGPKYNCSLAVSVLCNLNGVQGPQALERLGACDYVTELKHPSGCAIIINVHGGGWGWFGTLLIIVLCLFAAYLLAGIVYRFFFLGIRGIDIIPNLDFWVSLPRRTQSLCTSLVRKFKGPSEGYRSSYSPVNF
ncbi:uncharacterized protein LOC114395087 isoform X1 [Glycine soja]|uniref:uncharacterized protein LOC114395087 isoform X1 n=1 Tax=Glycine soja TaxID=3848 RepID=UPI00103DCB19|nr:uncharacterized protein LOC114395087 isoform X1 [Glycine soja]